MDRCQAADPRRPRRALRLDRDGRRSGRRRTRSCSSASCGWPCCAPRPSSASPCPTARSRPTSTVVDRGADAVDLDSIAARERVTRHDVKARIEEFAALAGHEQIHKGMTSRDLTENVEQLQVRAVAARWCGRKTLAVLARLARRAAEYDALVDGRPLAQRRRAGDHARQAVRHRRRRAAGRAGPPRRPARAATRCAASRARSAPRRTCSTCSTATPASWPQLERAVAAHLGFDARADQRRPGLPALARLRRAVRARAARRRAVLAGHDDPADGRQRAGHRGLPARPGRLRRRCRTR